MPETHLKIQAAIGAPPSAIYVNYVTMNVLAENNFCYMFTFIMFTAYVLVAMPLSGEKVFKSIELTPAMAVNPMALSMRGIVVPSQDGGGY